MIAIIDYGMGNIKSVYKALIKVGADAVVTSTAKTIKEAKAIILPGVGAFADCMNNLISLNLIDCILDEIKAGKHFLGICLGLQLLFTQSEEFGLTKGLNVFEGTVKRFSFDASVKLKVPHMGWNTVKQIKDCPLFDGIEDNSYFYFVHSYYVLPKDLSIAVATTNYGIDFTPMVHKDNVYAVQFHPEKSQSVGLKMLANFCRL